MDEPWITSYAEPHSGWESWWEEYRFGAFYVFPPEPVRSRVNRLRTLYDPRSQEICDAHVSLTVPLPRPLTREQWEEIGAVLRRIPPFRLEWGPPYQYPNIAGAVLRIEPVAELAEIVTALEACPCFVGSQRQYPFSPHMTIAEFVDVPRTAEILRELASTDLTGSFLCTDVTYAVPDGAFRFTARGVWRLGG